MRRPARLAALAGTGLVVVAALAFLAGPQASDEPDGLERVATDEGFADTATGHALDGAPTARYRLDGVEDEGLGTGLAGLIGVVAVFGLAGGLLLVVRRAGARTGRRPDRPGARPRSRGRRSAAAG